MRILKRCTLLTHETVTCIHTHDKREKAASMTNLLPLGAVLQLLLFISSHLHLGAAQSCGSLSETELIRRRIESVKLNLLAQLGITEDQKPIPANATVAPPTNETLMEFSALVNASKSIEKTREKKCLSEDFLAKPVSFFAGSMYLDKSVIVTKRQVELAEPLTDEAPTTSHRGDSSSVLEQNGVLVSYRIDLRNFHLPSELSEITQADLLLFQQPTVTGPDIEVRDIEQFVEIRTVLPVGERHVVEGKYLNLFDSGPKVFDIAPAVKLWLAKQIEGNITLEVVIRCFSSPDCADTRSKGTSPAVLHFDYQSGKDKEPKVMILSRNPLEVQENAKRRKRQAQQPRAQPTKFCRNNETICCLKPLVLNFRRDLGMDFITQPESFEANFCEGYCPELSGEDVMTSARFQFLRKLKNSPASSIMPCCSGSEYRSLDVLMNKYKHQLGRYVTVIERLQQVTVTKCKCA